MTILATLVDLSRWQFALTAMYHWLFVPLTLGLGFLIAFMETRYVMTGETDHEVLDEAFRRQLRNGRGDRNHPGV